MKWLLARTKATKAAPIKRQRPAIAATCGARSKPAIAATCAELRSPAYCPLTFARLLTSVAAATAATAATATVAAWLRQLEY